MPELDELAGDLDRAVSERVALHRITARYPDLTPDRAYDIQWRGIELRRDRGERLIGAKLGLTSEAKQRQMKVADPIFGRLTDAMIEAPGMALDLGRFIHPRVEPEIAFLTGEELEAPVTAVDVLAATRSVFGALEVIDSRYEAFDFTLPDVIADNASSASMVIGPVASAPAEAGDLRLLGCVLRRNGEVVQTAAGAAVMEHPASAVAWLVNRLGERGQYLPAGSTVLSGALTDAIPIVAGSTISAEYDGLGTVTVRA